MIQDAAPRQVLLVLDESAAAARALSAEHQAALGVCKRLASAAARYGDKLGLYGVTSEGVYCRAAPALATDMSLTLALRMLPNRKPLPGTDGAALVDAVCELLSNNVGQTRTLVLLISAPSFVSTKKTLFDAFWLLAKEPRAAVGIVQVGKAAANPSLTLLGQVNGGACRVAEHRSEVASVSEELVSSFVHRMYI